MLFYGQFFTHLLFGYFSLMMKQRLHQLLKQHPSRMHRHQTQQTQIARRGELADKATTGRVIWQWAICRDVYPASLAPFLARVLDRPRGPTPNVHPAVPDHQRSH